MNEITVIEKMDLISPEDISMIRQYDEINKRYKVWVDSHKEAFDKFLTEKGLESYEQDGVKIYRTKPYVKRQVDVKALKDQGLYDSFTKEVSVEGSIRISIDYED